MIVEVTVGGRDIFDVLQLILFAATAIGAIAAAIFSARTAGASHRSAKAAVKAAELAGRALEPDIERLERVRREEEASRAPNIIPRSILTLTHDTGITEFVTGIAVLVENVGSTPARNITIWAVAEDQIWEGSLQQVVGESFATSNPSPVPAAPDLDRSSVRKQSLARAEWSDAEGNTVRGGWVAVTGERR